MKIIKKIFRIFIYILNALALIALLLAAFSDHVSPFSGVFFSYLGLFFPFILLFNLAMFFVWLFIRQWKLAVVNFLVFLICADSIHTYFPIHSKTKEIPEDCIKLLTYNVMRFGYPFSKKDESKQILQYIRDTDAGIVCIQEFGISKSFSKVFTENDVNMALDKYPYHKIENYNIALANEQYGIAIYSKFPILSVKKVPYESSDNGSIVCELDIRGKRVTLIDNHLESNKLTKEERDNYYQMTQDPDSRSLDAFTGMMTKRLTPAYQQRALQAQLISKIIEDNKNPYIIVCGDFNDTPISYSRHKIKGNLHDAFVDSGCGLGITYNRYRFLFRIDYILHSDNIKAYNCTVGNLRSSDHFPVWCYLQLK